MRNNNIFQKNILRITKKYRAGAVIAVMALATACLGCGEQKSSQGNIGATEANITNSINAVVSESKSETVKQTEATTEAPTETKEYSFEDAKADVIWHFKRLVDFMQGTYFINDSECTVDDKGYTITVRYNYGEYELYKYGVGKDVYVATVFVEKDTKIMEYLSGALETLDDLNDKIEKGKKVQL